jgi:hypothetical protein
LFVGGCIEEGVTTRDEALKWVSSGKSKFREIDNGIRYVSRPDFHSPSFLTLNEFREVLSVYKRQNVFSPGVRYKALLAAMGLIAVNGYHVRIVFWFDN